MSKNESKNKRTFLTILSILLSFAVGVMASNYLQTWQSYTANFRVAKVGYHNGNNYVTGDFDIEFSGVSYYDEPILNGQSINLDTYVKNTGTIDAFVFVKIDDIPMYFQLETNELYNWKKVDEDHLIYYYDNDQNDGKCAALPKNQKVNFISNVTFNGSTLDLDRDYTFEVKMTAYAIQTYGLKDLKAKDIWEEFIIKNQY